MSNPDSNKQLAAALGRVASGIFVVTVRRGDAETGMLASWIQQCAFEPPHVSLAIRSGRPILDWLQEDDHFTINILDDTQTDMIVHFGKGFDLQEPAFTGLEVERSDAAAAPILTEALAYLEGRVASRQTVGDHDLLVAQVLSGRVLGEGHPMVHVRKSGMHY